MLAMRIVRTWSGVGQAVWKRALACSPGRVGPGKIPFTDLQLDLTLTEGSGCTHGAAFRPLGKDGEFSGGWRVSVALPHRKGPLDCKRETPIRQTLCPGARRRKTVERLRTWRGGHTDPIQGVHTSLMRPARCICQSVGRERLSRNCGSAGLQRQRGVLVMPRRRGARAAGSATNRQEETYSPRNAGRN